MLHGFLIPREKITSILETLIPSELYALSGLAWPLLLAVFVSQVFSIFLRSFLNRLVKEFLVSTTI